MLNKIRRNPGPCTHDDAHGLAGEDMNHRRTGRGIADSHFAKTDDANSRIRQFPGNPDTDFDRLDDILTAHRRPAPHIVSPVANLAMPDRQFRRQVRFDADIHQNQPGAGMAGQHIDSGTAAHKIVYHLFGYFGRKSADSFFRHAMVRRHQNDRLFRNPRHGLPLDAGQLAGHPLQNSQTAQRLGQAIQVHFSLIHDRFVKRLDALNDCVDFFHGCFLPCSLQRAAARSSAAGCGTVADTTRLFVLLRKLPDKHQGQ